MKAKKILRFVVHVLKQPAYAGLAACVAILIIILSTYALNIELIRSIIAAPWTTTAKAGLLLKLLGGVVTNNTILSFVLLLMTSMLAGTNIALATYQWKKHRQLSITQQGLSTTGLSAGVLAAGCSSCGISILAALGLAGSVAFLPLGGLEISILGILILFVTLIWLAKNNHTC